jgi:hypothetical protein
MLTRDPASIGNGGWHLTPVDHALVAAKSRANRLRFAVMLLFFRDRGRFPRGADTLDPQAMAGLARYDCWEWAYPRSPTFESEFGVYEAKTVRRH